MTPDWVFQFLWFSAGIGGTGAVWYFLSQRQFQPALWAGFGTAVLVCLTIALHIRNGLLAREARQDVRVMATAAPESHELASQPSAQAPSADEIAAAIAARLPTPRQERSYSGPFPPFSLGGSLEQTDYRDVFLTNRDWKPVMKGLDVTIDWDSIGSTDLVVDAVVKGTHGVCRLGLWDVGNDVVVAESGSITVDPTAVNVAFPVPREAGRKTYRLVTRGSENGSTAYFGATGEINFPSYSLGGSTTLEEPSAGADWHPVEHFGDVEIDWSRIQPPINKVLLDAALVVSDYIRGESSIPPTGRGRVRLKNLVDNTIVAESDWVEAGRRSMHHSYWPGGGTLRRQLPAGTGRTRYRLEISSSGPVVAVAATGRLLLRH